MNLNKILWGGLVFFGIGFVFTGCKKTTDYKTASIHDYFPLVIGKYITYQLDSLVYIPFSTRDTIISYQVKYQVDSLITDNIGRPAYRIYRLIRKNSSQSWLPDATFMAIPTTLQIEFVENNLRFIKLQQPINELISWKGNSYIDTYSANSTLKYLDNWNYFYSHINENSWIQNFEYENVITVNQRDETIGNPDNPNSYSEINFGEEKYAKGIGLIYKKFTHREYQPGNGGYIADGSYGVTLQIIDHN